MPTELIYLAGISRKYLAGETETTALNNIGLQIMTGEFVAIMGPSGCGKTTLLNILGLLDRPDKGLYQLAGSDVSAFGDTERSRARRGMIGFVFQYFNLIPNMTVYENIELPMILLDISPKARRERIEHLLEQLHIAHRRRHYPSQLSGGQQQRAAFARAMGPRPRLILADEPTGNLDSANGEHIMSLLEDAHASGTTIVMVTHSPVYASRAQRTIRLFDGNIASVETPHYSHFIPN